MMGGIDTTTPIRKRKADMKNENINMQDQ